MVTKTKSKTLNSSSEMLAWQFKILLSEIQQIELHLTGDCPCVLNTLEPSERCVGKHLLNISSVSYETAQMDSGNKDWLLELADEADEKHEIFKDFICHKEDLPELAEWARNWRKKHIEPVYYTCRIKSKATMHQGPQVRISGVCGGEGCNIKEEGSATMEKIESYGPFSRFICGDPNNGWMLDPPKPSKFGLIKWKHGYVDPHTKTRAVDTKSEAYNLGESLCQKTKMPIIEEAMDSEIPELIERVHCSAELQQMEAKMAESKLCNLIHQSLSDEAEAGMQYRRIAHQAANENRVSASKALYRIANQEGKHYGILEKIAERHCGGESMKANMEICPCVLALAKGKGGRMEYSGELKKVLALLTKAKEAAYSVPGILELDDPNRHNIYAMIDKIDEVIKIAGTLDDALMSALTDSLAPPRLMKSSKPICTPSELKKLKSCAEDVKERNRETGCKPVAGIGSKRCPSAFSVCSASVGCRPGVKAEK